METETKKSDLDNKSSQELLRNLDQSAQQSSNDHKEEDEEEEEEEEEEKIVEKSPNSRFHKRNKRFPKQIEGVDNAFVAIEPKSGKEVIWNECIMSEKKTDKENRYLSLIKKLKKNSHPFLVRFLDVWIAKSDDVPRKLVFITERLDECTLKQFLCNSAKNNRLWKRHVGQLLSVLMFLHRLGIKHGNLKKESIYYQNSGNLKVGPFDLGCILDKNSEMSDIHALGVVALEIAVWTPTDFPPNLTVEESCQQMFARLENEDQKSFVEVCFDASIDNKCPMKRLVNHPAVTEVPTLKLLSARAIVNSMISMSNEEGGTTDSTGFTSVLKDYLNRYEDETVIIEVHFLVDDINKSKSWKDFRSNFTLTPKYLEDVRNGFYPLFGCRWTWDTYQEEAEYGSFYDNGHAHVVTGTNRTEPSVPLATYSSGTSTVPSTSVSRKHSTATRPLDGMGNAQSVSDNAVESTHEDVTANGSVPGSFEVHRERDQANLSSSVQAEIVKTTLSTNIRSVSRGEGSLRTSAIGTENIPERDESHAHIRSFSSAYSISNQAHGITEKDFSQPVESLSHSVNETVRSVVSPDFSDDHSPNRPDSNVQSLSNAMDATNAHVMLPQLRRATLPVVNHEEDGTTEKGYLNIGGKQKRTISVSNVKTDNKFNDILTIKQQGLQEKGLNKKSDPGVADLDKTEAEIDHEAEDEEDEEEEEYDDDDDNDKDLIEAIERYAPQTVHVAAPDRAPNHPALFTHCQYLYIGAGRWQVYVQMWFVEDRLKRETYVQVFDYEWHDCERVADLFEASRCLNPSDRPNLKNLLALARHNCALIDGELQFPGPVAKRSNGFDAFELREKLTALHLHQQAQELLMHEELSLDRDLSIRNLNDDKIISTEQSNVESATLPIVTIVNDVPACAEHIAQVKNQQQQNENRTQDSQIPLRDTPKQSNTDMQTFTVPLNSKLENNSTDTLFLDVGALAPRNAYCALCDTHDYLHRIDLPAYLISPCYHCREYLAREAKVTPENLLDLHLQNNIPWPAFLQARFNIPNDGRSIEELIAYDCRWRSRQPCRCLISTGGTLMPPCVEFPWLASQTWEKNHPASSMQLGVLKEEPLLSPRSDKAHLPVASGTSTDAENSPLSVSASQHLTDPTPNAPSLTSTSATVQIANISSSAITPKWPCANRHPRGAPTTCCHGIRFPLMGVTGSSAHVLSHHFTTERNSEPVISIDNYPVTSNPLPLEKTSSSPITTGS